MRARTAGARPRLRRLLSAGAPTLVLAFAFGLPAAAHAATITEFSSGLTPTSDFAGIDSGADGNLWFADTKAIARITPDGVITEFTAGLDPGSMLFSDILAGPDGNLWFGDHKSTPAIGRVTTAGTIHEFTSGLSAGSSPDTFVAGADGNVWFTDPGIKAIGKVTPAGAITETSTGINAVSSLEDMTFGPDGNLWFTDRGNTPGIGRVKPDGSIHEFSSGLKTGTMPVDIAAGPDGNVWFTDSGAHAVGRVKPDGTIDEFDTGMGTDPDAITAGADGNVWFDDENASQRAVGRVTPSGVVTEFHDGLSTGDPNDITLGADGNIWVAQSGPGSVARVTPGGTITEFTAGFNPGGGSDGDVLIPGPDGNLWLTDRGSPKAIARVVLDLSPLAATGAASAVTDSGATVAGSVTPLSTATTVAIQYGTTPALGSTAPSTSLRPGTQPVAVSTALTGLPAGSTVFYRVAATNAHGTTTGSTESFTTPADPVPTTPPPPKGGPPALITTSATAGDQAITLTTLSPLSCSATTLGVSLASVTQPASHAAKLHLSSAALFIDGGVRHVKTKLKHLAHGKTKKVKVSTVTPNATVRHLPASVALSLSGLRSGSHRLTVTLRYRHTVAKHGRKVTTTVSKTLKTTFTVC